MKCNENFYLFLFLFCSSFWLLQGDQASIIGGAINFVKELEQQVHLLSAQTNVINNPFPSHVLPNNNIISSSSFPHHFFAFPSSSPSSSSSSSSSSSLDDSSSAAVMTSNNSNNNPNTLIQSSIGDIEVSMVDSHANLKITCKKLPKQLLKIVSGLHSLHLTVLHLNVSTTHQFVLYSFSLKVISPSFFQVINVRLRTRTCNVRVHFYIITRVGVIIRLFNLFYYSYSSFF